mmetsp:Transcript_20647/g.46574  ORF Transcript_20647/g.46574 Transcript_20647/m.46574 type:complete len:205 (+) Transcript_20647:159-773(+)
MAWGASLWIDFSRRFTGTGCTSTRPPATRPSALCARPADRPRAPLTPRNWRSASALQGTRGSSPARGLATKYGPSSSSLWSAGPEASSVWPSSRTSTATWPSRRPATSPTSKSASETRGCAAESGSARLQSRLQSGLQSHPERPVVPRRCAALHTESMGASRGEGTTTILVRSTKPRPFITRASGVDKCARAAAGTKDPSSRPA